MKFLGVVILDAVADVVIWRRLRAVQSMLDDWDIYRNPPVLNTKYSPILKFCGSDSDLARLKSAIKVLLELLNP